MRIFATIVAAALLAAPITQALEHNLNFDQGVSVPAVVKDLKKEAATVKTGHKMDARPLFDREERDCATISFRPEDPTTSERIRLESRIYRERCYDYPDPPRPPQYPRHPRNITHRDWDRRDGIRPKRRECHEEWARTERRQVRMEITGRGEMLPWERDVFQVCLQGQWLTTHTIDASHKYDIDTPGWNGDTILARAIRKIPSNPDAVGIQESAFAFDPETGNFAFEMKDRWSAYYAGEQVTFTVKLKRHHKNWFDATVLDKEITLPAAEAYRIDFAKYAQELSGDLKPGKTYYVNWRFKRMGSVSKDDWQKYRETGKANYEGKEIKALLTLSAR